MVDTNLYLQIGTGWYLCNLLPCQKYCQLAYRRVVPDNHNRIQFVIPGLQPIEQFGPCKCVELTVCSPVDFLLIYIFTKQLNGRLMSAYGRKQPLVNIG